MPTCYDATKPPIIGKEISHHEVVDKISLPESADVTEYDRRLANPLVNWTKKELISDVNDWVERVGLIEYRDTFVKGALIAQNPDHFEQLYELSEDDKNAIRRESTQKWKQPKILYWLITTCSMAAVVQGMDETVINGAQIFFISQFNMTRDSLGASRADWIVGLVNGAPYLACTVLGCWLTEPLNRWIGRRGTIFFSCAIAALASIWEAVVNNWWHLLIARFALGLGIGSKSATVPVYSAECAPAIIRGALVMQWQVWTAFGIMLGYVISLAFFRIPDTAGITGLNWRLMLGSTVVAPIIVCIQIYFCPESPRWYIQKGRFVEAFEAFNQLRPTLLQACRDTYYVSKQVEAEQLITRGRSMLWELFSIPRNRRATMAGWIVMFMQQFCGVNVIAYYSSVIFTENGFSQMNGLAASLGFGIINFLFSLPAFLTIDTFGRRKLLLTTFPLMALFLSLTAFGFLIQNLQAKLAVIAIGIYLFGMVYSSGEGPVPFTYCAEAFPLYIRVLGCSSCTAITWCFNFILALTFPSLRTAFTISGAFGWYAGWNVIGFFLVLLFVPETKSLTLEELDAVFSMPTRKHAIYQIHKARRWIKKYLSRSIVTTQIRGKFQEKPLNQNQLC